MKEIEMEEKIEETDAPTTAETVDAPIIPFPFRTMRENLGMSRKDVQDATGLSGSVVWRAEQEGKTISDEDAVKIVNFLSTAQPKVGTSAKPKPTNAQVIVAEYEQRLADRDLMLALVRSAVDDAIAAAKEAKRSSKDLQSILDLLNS